MDPDRHLYEVIVPVVPPPWNSRTRVTPPTSGASDHVPTAVAHSLLDVSQPALDEGEDYDEYWLLSHLLLDGHHKVADAAAAGRPIRLLSLIDERLSIARSEDLDALVRVRRGPDTPRRTRTAGEPPR